jgi:C4-dicarboxylate transporter DctQ subunit
MSLTNWGKTITRGMRVSDYISVITLLALVALEAVIVVDVIAREIFRIGFIGVVSLSGLLSGVIVFSGVAAGWRDGEFVKVNVFKRHLPQRVQAVIDVFTVLLGLGCCAVLVWLSLEATISAFSLGLRAVGLHIHIWPWKIAVPLGVSFLCYEMMARLIRDIRQLTHKDMVP